MLSRLLSRGIAPFSRQFYNPTTLDFPINVAEESSIRNKAMMDEVNNNFSGILKKVQLLSFRSPFRAIKKFLISCINQAS